MSEKTITEELNWKVDTMKCGHQVENCQFYIDDDNIIRMKYICKDGCSVPWVKLGKAVLPSDFPMEE